jgi:hypothetical protein
VSGGHENKADANGSVIVSGTKNTTTGEWSSILGGKEITLSTENGTSP